ncbi:hypothetical protein ACFQV2_14125 [Actinokineospora soli]|uniref:Uncharacterized protein n=1 Tax=Actinokineospora soli TaxID=1048753 RepID=A0ABW2TL71_9PSEU
MFDDRAPDTHVRYRTDALGRRVAVLPATCKLGHPLTAAGYRIIEDRSARVVRVSCTRCADAIEVDHFWSLTTAGAAPDHVELDDSPYVGTVPVMIIPHAQR